MLHCFYKQTNTLIRIFHSILLHISRNLHIEKIQHRQIRDRKERNMGNTKVLLLMLCLAVCVGICRSWVEDVDQDAKARAEEDAKETTDSIADWATDTFSHFRVEYDHDHDNQAPQNVKYEAEDAASRATDSETIKSAASGAMDYTSQKVTDTKEAISGAMAYGRDKASEAYNGADEIIRMPTDTDAMNQAKEKMQDTYVDAKQKFHTASDKASNMAFNAKDNMANVYEMASEKFYDAKDKGSDVYDEARNKISDMSNDDVNERVKMASQRMYDVKDKVKNAMDYGKDKAYDVYDEAKDKMGYGRDKVDETFDQATHEVSDAYMSARNSMSEEAKVKYEAAKEKASEATGNLGAKMRNSPEI